MKYVVLAPKFFLEGKLFVQNKVVKAAVITANTIASVRIFFGRISPIDLRTLRIFRDSLYVGIIIETCVFLL